MSIERDGQRGNDLIHKLKQNWRWSKAHSWTHLIEEHDLNPVVRGQRAMRKAWWRLTHRNGQAPAIPVFLVGVQRSGTNMLAHGLDETPEFHVYNEGNRKAFKDFHFRPLAAIDPLIKRCRAKYVLFKPLCDSHRTPELLDHFGPAARAIWAYRNVDGRIRSAVAKFGDSNLRVLRTFATGEEQQPWNAWQVQRVSAENAAFIRSFDFDSLSAESGAALFWYIRNSLYFEMGLDRRDDTILFNYDQFLAEPEKVARALCAFLGFGFRKEMIGKVDPRRPSQRPPLAIDPRIRERCTALKERLDALCAAQLSRALDEWPARPAGAPVSASVVAHP